MYVIVCMQVYVSNSGKQEGITHPFGYLKASSSLTHVTLFVMPYNYRELLPLAGQLLCVCERERERGRDGPLLLGAQVIKGVCTSSKKPMPCFYCKDSCNLL